MNYTTKGLTVLNAQGHTIATHPGTGNAERHAARLNRTVGAQAEIVALVAYLTELSIHASYAPDIIAMLLDGRSSPGLAGVSEGLHRCGIGWYRSSEGSRWPFLLQTQPTENWSSYGAYTDLDNLIRNALRLRVEYPSLQLRVVHHYLAKP